MIFNTYNYFCNIDLWLSLRFPLQKTSSVMPRLCPQSKQLIILRLYHNNVYCKLPRSDNPIFAYILRRLLWSWQLGSACNTARYFIKRILTLPHCRCSLAVWTFLCSRTIDPYIRRFISCFQHSRHIYFIDPRPMGYTIHLWTAFVLAYADYGIFQPTSPSFWPLQFSKSPVGVSGETFQDVTPSFHLSDYQFS